MSETVTVACKIPAGLVLQCYTMEENQEPMFGGGTRTVSVARPNGEPVRIAGPAKYFGEEPRAQVVAGYALTHNVDKEWWDNWEVANAQSPLIKNNLLFAYKGPSRAEAVAREHVAVRSGIEGLNTSTRTEQGRQVPVDPRWPRREKAQLSNLGTDRGTDAA